MINRDRFADPRAMYEAFEADPCMHQTWCFPHWLFCEFSEDRLTYLKNLASHGGIGTCALVKEIRRLERLAAKEVKNV